VPDPKPTQRVTLTQGALDRMRAAVLRDCAEAVRRAGPARFLAAVATLDERASNVEEVLLKVDRLAGGEDDPPAAVTLQPPSAPPPQSADPVHVALGRPAEGEVYAATSFYLFAAGKLVNDLTRQGVVIPAQVAEALTTVEGWCRTLAPRPPPEV
jgi:hypothetical protein